MASFPLDFKPGSHLVRPTSLAWAVAFALATVPLAQAATSGPGAPLGSQIVVAPPASYPQIEQKVAMDATGDFVVAWKGYNPGTHDTEIYAQRYASGGAPLGSAIQVNSDTSGFQGSLSVAMDAAGDFVVVWESDDQASPTSGYDVYAQLYASNGTTLGSNFLVNSYTSGNQRDPSVAMDAAGDFVVAWESDDQASPTSGYDVYAERYASNGAPLGSAFLVNSYTSGFQGDPSVAMDAAGDFVVAWESDDQASPTSGDDVYAERYASNGAPLGSIFLVNTNTSTNQGIPSVAMDATGDFVVTWKGYNAQSMNTFESYAQRYAADGSAQGTNFLVPPFTSQTASVHRSVSAPPSVALDAVGDFVISQGDIYAFYKSGSTHKYVYSAIVAQRYQGESSATANVAVTGVSSGSTVAPGFPFSVSFEVVNRTAPSFETSDAYLNRFIGAVSDPTITVTLPPQVASFPAGGANWSCTGSGVSNLSCTYTGLVPAGQYSPPLIVNLVAPGTPGTVVYGATAVGSSEPPFTGSVAVANPPSTDNGGGGGFGWLELLGLLGFGILARRHRPDPARGPG